ncbi:nuclease-related domain-containing protein [Thalassobacillus hwangdonensis]|uniref:Nuclease-related domain-containing protein n=1 Tax=Thalassobacillus hwangdonensis TaxID=546108 RepID=A0ABW3L400_9BACI
MIVKPLSKPVFLEQLEVLKKRIPTAQPKREEIIDTHARISAGYAGEKALYSLLSKLPLDVDSRILFDLRLPLYENFHFQLDAVLLTKRYVLIFEVKNISGTSFLDGIHRQLIRDKEGIQSGLPDPVSQAERHRIHLSEWLLHHHFPSLPIDSLVVFTNRTSVIKSSPDYADARLKTTRIENLAASIKQIHATHHNKAINSDDINRLTQLFLTHHSPYDPNILERFSLTKEEIQIGVSCPSCGVIPMIRLYGKWSCKHCNETSKVAHQAAFNDYKLLFSKKICNKDARDFLLVQSRNTVKRLLSDMNLRSAGAKKNRYYFLE